MYRLLRELLFLLPPETAHHFSLQSLNWMDKLLPFKHHKSHSSAITVMGLTFPNRVGLAAGLDKNGDYIDSLGHLGFGFVEVGTVTPRAQPGNPKPRLFRLKQVEAIINRMGFNNKGVEHLIEQASQRRYAGVLGINIGKNFDTPIERAVDDYLIGLRKAYPFADYITVNISSPNTPGLRDLQKVELLRELLEPLKAEQQKLAAHSQRNVPLVVKLAPDQEAGEIQSICEIFNELEIEGVIATNTTLSRAGVEGLEHASEAGGLSGRPLLERSTEVVRTLRQYLNPDIALIAAGGISSAEDMQLKIDAGADLVQIYSGFIYRGPALVKELVRVT